MLLAVVLVSVVFSAHAQSVPKPKEFYFDEDKTMARPIVVVEGPREKPRCRHSCANATVAADMLEATAQLAHIAFSDGRTDLGGQLYQQALAQTDVKGATWGAAVQVELRVGPLIARARVEPALTRWVEACQCLRDRTLVGAAHVGAGAVAPGPEAGSGRLVRRCCAHGTRRSGPTRATSPRIAPRLEAQEDRDTLAEVLGAWQANPPTWP
ncbi:hypothetical protein [Pseudoxanthomonas mexicana]